MVTPEVNGQVRRVDVSPQGTIATTLRYELGLTGTRLGCDRGECGAYTVLLDDVAKNSCPTWETESEPMGAGGVGISVKSI